MRPMRRIILLFAALLGIARAGAADSSDRALDQALSTLQMFSDTIDSRLVRYHNTRPGATGSAATGYSVLLNFDNVYWLYTPNRGTRSLGPAEPRTADLAKDISARLQRIAPDLTHVEILDRRGLHRPTANGIVLDNGCFPSCLARLITLYAAGEPVEDAGIIFFTTQSALTVQGDNTLLDVGHSMLVYRTNGRWVMMDPSNPKGQLPAYTPQVGAEVDPAVLAYARERNYPFSHAEYRQFAPATLDRLSANVGWKFHLAVE